MKKRYMVTLRGGDNPSHHISKSEAMDEARQDAPNGGPQQVWVLLCEIRNSPKTRIVRAR